MFIKYVFFFTTLACYLSFAWSVIGVFKTQEVSYRQLFLALKLSSVTFWGYSLCLFSMPLDQSFGWFVFGIIINVLSFGLFVWSTHTIRNESFSTVYGKDIPDKVVQKGPFKMVRNPFYSSYILCYLGSTVTQQSFVLLGLLTFLVGLYLVAIKIEENKFYYSQDFHTFIKYKQNTGMLYPKLKVLAKKKKESFTEGPGL